MNQNAALLTALESDRNGITQAEAARKLGIQRLSERVREIECLGWKIGRVTLKHKNRYGHYCYPVRYFLVSAPKRRNRA